MGNVILAIEHVGFQKTRKSTSGISLSLIHLVPLNQTSQSLPFHPLKRPPALMQALSYRLYPDDPSDQLHIGQIIIDFMDGLDAAAVDIPERKIL